jgi:hypothetical protein
LIPSCWRISALCWALSTPILDVFFSFVHYLVEKYGHQRQDEYEVGCDGQQYLLFLFGHVTSITSRISDFENSCAALLASSGVLANTSEVDIL